MVNLKEFRALWFLNGTNFFIKITYKFSVTYVSLNASSPISSIASYHMHTQSNFDN